MILALKVYIEVDEKLNPEAVRMLAESAEDLVLEELSKKSSKGNILKIEFSKRKFQLKLLSREDVRKKYFTTKTSLGSSTSRSLQSYEIEFLKLNLERK